MSILSPTNLYVFSTGEPGGFSGPSMASLSVDDALSEKVRSDGMGLSGERVDSDGMGLGERVDSDGMGLGERVDSDGMGLPGEREDSAALFRDELDDGLSS